MCGLVGVAGDLIGKDLDVMKDLLYCSERRGADATGVGTFRADTGYVELLKQAVPSHVFLDSRRNEGIFKTTVHAMLGHTRKATYANKWDRADAHPFHHGDIIGAHNGSIPYQALEKLKTRKYGCIDSEEIIHHINEHGLEDTLPRIWGAWALELVDTKNKKLQLIHNAQRPLSVAFSKDKKRMYWASEYPMLQWVLWRNGIELFNNTPMPLEEDTLYEFDLADKKVIGENWTMSLLKGGEEPAKKPSTTTSGTTTVYSRGRQTTAVAKVETPTTSSTSGSSAAKPESGNEKGKHSDLTLAEIMAKYSAASFRLLEFDFSRRHTWSKNIKQRFAALKRQVEIWEELLYMRQKEALSKATEVEFNPPFLKNVGMTANVFRTLFAQNGCAYCCQSDSDGLNLLEFEISPKNNEILCPNCAKDEILRAIAGLPDLPNQGNKFAC